LGTLEEHSPRKIEHIVDTDFDPRTGEFSFFYNYLLYTFDHPAGTVTARSYLDTASEVSLLRRPETTGSDREFAGILAYLRRRYPTVKALEPGGYHIPI